MTPILTWWQSLSKSSRECWIGSVAIIVALMGLLMVLDAGFDKSDQLAARYGAFMVDCLEARYGQQGYSQEASERLCKLAWKAEKVRDL